MELKNGYFQIDYPHVIWGKEHELYEGLKSLSMKTRYKEKRVIGGITVY